MQVHMVFRGIYVEMKRIARGISQGVAVGVSYDRRRRRI